MKVQFSMPDQNPAKQFKILIHSLAAKFQPIRIISFGKQPSLIDQECTNTKSRHYCLLLIMKDATRIDYEVQDYANNYYPDGQVTIICHGEEKINAAVNANNRFFITALNTGQTLYSKDGFAGLNSALNYLPTTAYEKAKKHFLHRISLAEAFLDGAQSCLIKMHFNICTFMLYQAAEQCCIGLIRVQMAYKSEFHNLERLLNLCRCFSDEPYNLFLSGSTLDKRLFNLLSKSYSHARYERTFQVEKEDAEMLINKISDFLQIIKKLCRNKMLALEALNSLKSKKYGERGGI